MRLSGKTERFKLGLFERYGLIFSFIRFTDGVRTLKYNNGSYKIEQTVPDYFSGVVLQRRNVLKQEDDLMNVKFSVAFNLAIVWIIIFLSLSKGELERWKFTGWGILFIYRSSM